MQVLDLPTSERVSWVPGDSGFSTHVMQGTCKQFEETGDGAEGA